jgi:hypothetical protein
MPIKPLGPLTLGRDPRRAIEAAPIAINPLTPCWFLSVLRPGTRTLEIYVIGSSAPVLPFAGALLSSCAGECRLVVSSSASSSPDIIFTPLRAKHKTLIHDNDDERVSVCFSSPSVG